MSSVKVDGISMSFQNLLAKICFHHHFSGKSGRANRWLGPLPVPVTVPCLQGLAPGLTPRPSVAVVERVDSCASMYSRSIQGHHVCLLVKKVSPMGGPQPGLSTPRRCASLSLCL